MLQPETPPQVRQAIILLWVAQIVVVIDAVLTLINPEPDMAGETGFLVFLFLIVLAVYATLITFAARRKNWARIALLISVISTSAGYFLLPSETPDPWWTEANFWLSSILELLAMYWLFSGAGARWYAVKALQ
ncbi:MAG TPA: hypothetical protein VE934_04525 [Polaromonas sp.]|uniref:hypothetical protein n=1 Tax=Polaromonas sp. TaxID=1869339 RepID=UPI002D2CAB7B|nr:hypothetical protein [Polaromonas sp.]HYW56200.1 hypothetical protein [Polaromonas sp.]